MKGILFALVISALVWAIAILAIIMVWPRPVTPAEVCFYTPEYPVCMMSVPAFGIVYKLSGPLDNIKKVGRK